MLVDTLLVGLLDRDHRVPAQVLKFCQDFLGHLPYAVFHKPRIFMRGKYHVAFVAALEELVDPAAHRYLEDPDDLLKVDMLVVIGLDAQESLAPLVVRGHRDCCEELIDLALLYIKTFENPHCPLFHDVLGAGTGGHPGDFSTDTLPHDRGAECAAGNGMSMDFNDLMAGCVADRCLALDHELAPHEDLSPVGVFMAVEEFSGNNAAEFFNLVDVAIDCLLEDFIDDLEIAREVGALEAAGEVDIHIKVGDEDDRAFASPVHFHQFLYVLDTDPGQVDTDIR